MRAKLSTQGLLSLLCAGFNKPYSVDPSTTLNSKYNILPAVSQSGIKDKRYLGLGIGGTVADDNGEVDVGLRQRDMSLIDLYSGIPFVARPQSNDLSSVDRQKYRLRKETTIGGVPYVLYYLKDITEVVNNSTEILKLKSADGMVDTVYSHGDETPPITGTVYFDAELKVYIVLTEEEVDDLRSVLELMYPTDEITEITEVGIYTGTDFQTPDGIEAVDVQLFMSGSGKYNIGDDVTSLPVSLTFNVGGI